VDLLLAICMLVQEVAGMLFHLVRIYVILFIQNVSK